MPQQTTILRLAGMGVPPYSVRGTVEQTLEPIDQASFFLRDVDGVLFDVSPDQFALFRSTVSGRDVDPPAIEMRRKGAVLTVDCIPELCYEDDSDSTPERTPVEDSTRTENGFVFYRPQLEMVVIGFSVSKNEYAAEVRWELELEELGPAEESA